MHVLLTCLRIVNIDASGVDHDMTSTTKAVSSWCPNSKCFQKSNIKSSLLHKFDKILPADPLVAALILLV